MTVKGKRYDQHAKAECLQQFADDPGNPDPAEIQVKQQHIKIHIATARVDHLLRDHYSLKRGRVQTEPVAGHQNADKARQCLH